MNGRPPQPEQMWPRWLRLAALGLATGIAGLLALIITGVFDPKPAGPPAASAPIGPVEVAAGAETSQWVPAVRRSAERRPISWRLLAAHRAGELDSGYGLMVGDDARALVVAVSPLGYASIWEQHGLGQAQDLVHLPWQTWPHVATGSALNELWLDVTPVGGQDEITVRINREVLWRGSVTQIGPHAGWWAASFGGAVNVDFRQLTRFDGPLQGERPP